MGYADIPGEEQLLRVSGGTPPDKLAAAISNAVYDGKRLTLRCIGAASVNQAVKGIAVAQGFVGQRGLTLLCRPGFTTVLMNDGESISAIVLKIFAS